MKKRELRKHRILLADSMVLMRQALKIAMELERAVVVAEAADANQALRLATAHRPDVAILDHELPPLGGLSAARQIRKACPAVRIVLLVSTTNDHSAIEALSTGVQGVVPKSASIKDLSLAIGEIERGCLYMGPTLLNRQPDSAGAIRLTNREQQVLKLVALGNSTRQIGALLNVSTKTAGFHRERLMKKLNIHEIASLVRFAIRQGLVTA